MPSLSAVMAALLLATPALSASTCATKGRPSGKVLMGYWENWDGSKNGVHPGYGWTPIESSDFANHGYNVINAAFPIILPDGTAKW